MKIIRQSTYRNVQEGGPRYNANPNLRQSWGEWDRENKKKARLYISPVGETVLENLFEGRHNRPHVAFRDELLAEVLTAAGLDPTNVRANWSKHAGCSMCPCSPGFILTGRDGSYPLKGHSISVTFAADDYDEEVGSYVEEMNREAHYLRESERRSRELAGAAS